MKDFPVVVIGASAGGLAALRVITDALPPSCKAALAVVMHVGPHPNHLPDILNGYGPLPAGFVRDGDSFLPGRIYVAPSDHHVALVPPGRFHLHQGAKIHGTRPAIDPLFMSAASLYWSHTVGVILSGGGKDGAAGLRTIRNHGGVALAQDPVEAAAPEMPAAAFAADDPEVLPIRQIARRVSDFCKAIESDSAS